MLSSDNKQSMLVPELVAAQAARNPDAVAVAACTTLTYGELERRSNSLANHLLSLGVGPEVLVGICLERSIEQIVAALAIMKAGGAYLPLDPRYPPNRLEFVVKDAHAPVLITDERIAAGLPDVNSNLVLLAADSDGMGAYASGPPDVETASQQTAYVIYTSGSTGEPKGVQVRHSNLSNLVEWHHQAFGVTAADRATQLAAPAFDAAVWEVWPYLTAGASIHLPPEDVRTEPEKLRDWLVSQRITISFVPTILAEHMMFLKWPADTALRFLLTGADTLRHHPPASLPFAVINNYGPTECTVVATSGCVPPGNCRDGQPSIGRPIFKTSIHILDSNLQPVPPGTPGEIHIGGAGVARGYFNRPELTREKFIPDPFDPTPGARLYKTGDLGRLLPDGQIAFLGRIDDQIKIRGFRIEPEEIIAALNANPAVRESLVVARDDSNGEKRLIAYVVPAASASITDAELRDFLHDRVPEYMVPSVFVRLESLPVSPNGKLDRAILPDPSAANSFQESSAAARTPTEERIGAMVKQLLGMQQVGLHDNIFLLGGHSLLGAQLIVQLRAALGVEISLRTLFDGPTVAQLAEVVDKSGQRAPATAPEKQLGAQPHA